LEEALELWETTVSSAPNEIKGQEPVTGPEYNLMGLFPALLRCLKYGSENLKIVLRIIEGYLMIDGAGLMLVAPIADAGLTVEILGNVILDAQGHHERSQTQCNLSLSEDH